MVVVRGVPVLFQVVLALEALAAHLAGERQLGTLVRALVDHQVVALGEAALAVLADELALGAHLATELAPADVVVDLHYGEHLGARLPRCALAAYHVRTGCARLTAH